MTRAPLRAATAVLAAILVVQTPALADPEAVTTAAPDTVWVRRWYGWQTLLVDAAAFTLTVGGAMAESGAVAALGLLGYASAGAIVHGVHHHPAKAGLSTALRIGAPLLGARLFVAATEDCAGGGCKSNATATVGVAAFLILGASIADATILAHETVRVPRNSVKLDVRPAPNASGIVVGATMPF